MFQTKAVEKNKTHIFCSIFVFSRKSCRLWDKMDNYGRVSLWNCLSPIFLTHIKM